MKIQTIEVPKRSTPTSNVLESQNQHDQNPMVKVLPNDKSSIDNSSDFSEADSQASLSHFISDDILQRMNFDLKSKIAKRVANLPPKDFDKDLWELLDVNEKDLIWLSVSKKGKYQSRIVKFLFTSDNVGDPEAGINALIIVCALILAIPYGLAALFDEEFFQNLQVQLDSCGPNTYMGSNGFTYDYVMKQILQNWTCCVYSSMIGLCFALVFYLFKPHEDTIKVWMAIKGRILIICMFCATTSAVVSLMNLSADILNFVSMGKFDLCAYNITYLFVPGATILGLSFAFAIFLMW